MKIVWLLTMKQKQTTLNTRRRGRSMRVVVGVSTRQDTIIIRPAAHLSFSLHHVEQCVD